MVKGVALLLWPMICLAEVPEAAMACLVKNAFYEANTEGPQGRMLVTQVVLNRGRPSDACKTIFSPRQFSWTSVKQKDVPFELVSTLEREVLQVISGMGLPMFALATHYHNISVKPSWAERLSFLGRYGNHLFYNDRVVVRPITVSQLQPVDLPKLEELNE